MIAWRPGQHPTQPSSHATPLTRCPSRTLYNRDPVSNESCSHTGRIHLPHTNDTLSTACSCPKSSSRSLVDSIVNMDACEHHTVQTIGVDAHANQLWKLPNLYPYSCEIGAKFCGNYVVIVVARCLIPTACFEIPLRTAVHGSKPGNTSRWPKRPCWSACKVLPMNTLQQSRSPLGGPMSVTPVSGDTEPCQRQDDPHLARSRYRDGRCCPRSARRHFSSSFVLHMAQVTVR